MLSRRGFAWGLGGKPASQTQHNALPPKMLAISDYPASSEGMKNRPSIIGGAELIPRPE